MNESIQVSHKIIYMKYSYFVKIWFYFIYFYFPKIIAVFFMFNFE
jgi:hypothetical protein